ncbi:MAG TPA: response regulator [Nitrospirae bacterium]|nr:hydrogenase transcriptional regulatory protein hupR1 [bacterium BMS3Abin06]HDH12161.1 response regulator [Nitrospirota bacterium]HDZ02142.1 response regulator [Nitrospirota bacterium]
MDKEVKILCVDDEKSVLKSLERLFLDSDYEIITAISGDEGLETLKNTEPIQLVVSDYRMPGMNGVDFLKEVCKLRPGTVRIVLSGYADTAAIVEAINEGQIYKFIPKPWNDDELKVTISKALEHYFTNQKNIQLTKELEAKNMELQEINNNLEKLVEERTADLVIQNKILTASQNILDSLPVGVVGIDPGGLIVQSNKRGVEFFSKEKGNIIGMDRMDSFPEEINDFIEKLIISRTLTARIRNNGSNIAVKGVYMQYSNGQEGIILVLDDEVADDE